MQIYTEIPHAPDAVGPYSPAVISGNYIFFSGQIGIDPQTGKLAGSSIEEQTKQVCQNIYAVLNHFKKSTADIIKTTIFLTDMTNYQTVNALYAKWLGSHKPARSTVQVAGLPAGAIIEIECIVENISTK